MGTIITIGYIPKSNGRYPYFLEVQRDRQNFSNYENDHYENSFLANDTNLTLQ